MSNDTSAPTRGRSTTKKALLVGIGYDAATDRQGQRLEWESIPTSVPNVRALETFLKESCGYTDVTVMTDEGGVIKKYRPTKRNLKREIRALVRGVQPGDRRVFYFAGHSDQMPCETGSEEDGMDEVLVAVCGLKIRDNLLKKWLVKNLPKGSALTAIFDSCNSGTLLDLKHYACNKVYVPWVNKGVRKSKTLRNHVVRRDGRITQPPLPSRSNSTYRKGSCEAVHYRGMTQVMLEARSGSPLVSSTGDPDKHFGQRTASPERQFECDGSCRLLPMLETAEHPDVISISSSNDGQTSWDASTRTGGSISMTTYLIDILKKHPGITISKLMTLLNHAVHSFTTRMHGQVQKERRAAHRKGDVKHTGPEDADPEQRKGEMNNFQDLQLGSITPVDMNRPFVL